MKLIDTHAHLQFEKFSPDRAEVIQRTSEQLLAVINPGADLDSSEKAVELCASVTNFYSAVGVHPHHVDHWTDSYLPQLRKLVAADKVVAVGEIGLDNHQYHGFPEPSTNRQTEIFLPQIELAQEFQKPILFHCREAYNELYEVISRYKPLSGLMHCFMGDKATAKKFVDLGLLISFAGNLTYKGNHHMREAAAFLDQEQIVLETDSPYLTPESLRGQRNEPLNVLLVAETVAQVRGVSLENVAEFTTANARKLFNL